MLKLDISIHARSPAVDRGETIVLDGQTIATLDLARRDPMCLLGVSFEQAAERIVALDPMVHLEPDGWFIWHCHPGETPDWELNGQLYDRRERLAYVPLRGRCPEAVLHRLLGSLAGNPASELMFELTQAGIHVDLDTLVALARAGRHGP